MWAKVASLLHAVVGCSSWCCRLLLYARTLVGLFSRIPKDWDLVQTLLLQCDRPSNSDVPNLLSRGPSIASIYTLPASTIVHRAIYA